MAFNNLLRLVGLNWISHFLVSPHLLTKFACLFCSPEELWRQHKESSDAVSVDAFSNNGIKHEENDGSFLQMKQLEYVQSLYRKQLQAEKIAKL